MRIIVVDDEYLALEGTMGGVKKVVPDASVRGFQDPSEAVDSVRNESADVALLDIHMRTMDGLQLARELQEINPQINIIFTTGYREYMEDAFGIHVSGYIVKPVTPQKINAEFEHLRFPIPAEDEKKRVRIQTFGEFEVFIDDAPVEFAYAKTKEMFAYLIDRNGAMVTTGTLMSILWEEDENETGGSGHGSYLRNLVSDLTRVLRDKNCEDILLRRRGMIGIDKSNISCDYYDFLAGDKTAARLAGGEYMTQYSWGEYTHAAVIAALE
ncbi:MAG: response regulator [Eubacterium sp.]|nr:response regulator [Eubacterium sp.]